jgi:hypothetical protein
MNHLSKAERLALIYRNLQAAPLAKNQFEALAIIQSAFRDVEDAHSGVPDLPDHPDRMHPPFEDMEEEMPGLPNAKRYRHKRHYTVIAANGAFEIRRFLYANQEGKKRRIGEQTDFSKAGADGHGVDD